LLAFDARGAGCAFNACRTRHFRAAITAAVARFGDATGGLHGAGDAFIWPRTGHPADGEH
jgi:hypothetical protein